MSTRRALYFSFIDRYAALVLSIVSSMFIARLLTPADLGVYSVTMVFILFLSSMRDLGAGQYLVQEKELTPERIRATWTVLLSTGLLMAIVVLVAAYPVARFYHEPRMVEIMWVISINFAITPFGSMTYAWLMREMRFDALAVMRFGGSLAGASTSAFLAWKGHGPISLAYGNLLSSLVNAALSLRYRPASFTWWPGLKDVRRVIGFGSKISATGLVWNVASGAPELFLGKLQSLAAAGMYSRGNGLAQMFQRLILDATQAVALPMFAQAQREVGNINEPLLRALSYVTALGWSFFIGLALLGFPLTRLLYGNQWDDSVHLMRLLAIGMAIGLPAAMCPNALMAKGFANRILGITLVVVPIQVLCIGLGAAFSLEGAGIGFVVAQACSMPIWLIVTQRELGFRWRTFALVVLRSAALALVTTVAPASCVIIFGLQPESNWVPLLCAGIAGLVLFWLAAWWLKHPLQEEIERVTTAAGNRWRHYTATLAGPLMFINPVREQPRTECEPVQTHVSPFFLNTPMNLIAYRNRPSEQQRIADLLDLVPHQTTTALDIGARDGYISSRLADRSIHVTALDLEKPMVNDPRIRCVKGDITSLAFAESSFDLVLCAEVLEHIPPQLLVRGCAELQRVAGRYLLIGVPYRQDTRLGRTTCQVCGGINPPWGHVNRFDEARLRALFPGCTVEKISLIGIAEMGTNAVAAALMNAAGNPFGTYSQDEHCTHCGEQLGQPRPRSLMQKLLTRAATLMRAAQKPLHQPHANWIHMRLSKP